MESIVVNNLKQYIISTHVNFKKVNFKNKTRESNHVSILLAGIAILLLTSIASIPSSEAAQAIKDAAGC